jgi:glyoxylase-like metal-dependent hydrolase (beta-lactamase superfamily II)
MYLKTFAAGPLQTNAYLLADEEAGTAMIVDAPPGSAQLLLGALERAGLSVDLIVLTHPHWDHLVDTAALKAATGAEVAAHPDARTWLEQPVPLVMPIPYEIQPIIPDRLLTAGDEIVVGRYRFQVISTPGHAPGQISLYEPEERILFVGDTLFAGGYGRVDLPGSSIEQTLDTMRRLLELPDDVTVYPGHGRPTTIGGERPWMTRMVGQPGKS